MKPFVKWAGGKRQILNRINEFIDDSIEMESTYTYIEPFLGGGAVFFNRMPPNAIINDLNEDLINAYRIIKSDKYLELIDELKNHAQSYSNDPDEHYYFVRGWDREPNWIDNYSNVQRAARMIFLNRTCYNGLYRVNSKGQFNTPIGRYVNPTICDEDNIKEIHNYLSDKKNEISILNDSYEVAIRMAKDGDIIYIDPPYDYEDDDGFTKYHLSGFSFEDFKKLKRECDTAINQGAIVIVSNNATTKVLDLFEEDPKYKTIFYDINKFSTLRSINCNGLNRRTGKEAIFWGMNNNVPFPQANDMEKVVKLVIALSENSLINDKTAMKEIINVTSERQVAYYLSALLFFGYITHDKTITKKANQLGLNEIELRGDIYNQLMGNPIFSKQYQVYFKSKKVDLDSIKNDVSKSKLHLSDSTIHRRASTIKAWIEWMYVYDTEQKNFQMKI